MGWRGHREVAIIPCQALGELEKLPVLSDWTASQVEGCEVGRGQSRLLLVQGAQSLSKTLENRCDANSMTL